MAQEYQALASVSLKSYYTDADVWRDDVVSVDAIHKEAFAELRHLFDTLRSGGDPVHIVIEGRPGIGKSHFLGRVRRLVAFSRGLFVLIQLSSVRDFWESISLGFLDALFHESRDQLQIDLLLEGVGQALDLARADRVAMLAGEGSPELFKHLRTALMRKVGRRPADRSIIDVVLALCALKAEDPELHDLGYSFLQGLPLSDEDRRSIAISAPQLPPREIVRAIDQAFGLAGKTALVALDQLDGLIALSKSSKGYQEQGFLDQVGNGLMDLASDVEHTLIVVSCLKQSWDLIEQRVIKAVADRFPVHQQLRAVPDKRAGAALVAAYLKEHFDRVNFVPPYPTWPIQLSAFDEAPLYTPRELLKLTNDHITLCRQMGKVFELEAFGEANEEAQIAPIEEEPAAKLDTLFEALMRSAQVADVLADDMVDELFPPLLRAGLRAWMEEHADDGRFSIDALPSKNPAIHARLRQVVDVALEDEVHWCFRAIPHQQPRAALPRLQGAAISAGLGSRRHLLILRNVPWASDAKTKQTLKTFSTRGGQCMQLSEDDLRALDALAQLFAENPEGLIGWLRDAQPASGLALFQQIKPVDPKKQPKQDRHLRAVESSPPAVKSG